MRNVPVFGCASFFPDQNRPVPSFDKGALDSLPQMAPFRGAERLRAAGAGHQGALRCRCEMETRHAKERPKTGLIKRWALSNENNYGATGQMASHAMRALEVTMFCLTCDRLGVPRPVCVQNDYSLSLALGAASEGEPHMPS